MIKRINLGIIAHVDAGKTTLTEQLLFRSGALRQAGSVDRGTAQTDYMPVEQARGISVRAAATVLKWQDTEINLIDTPGHIDFAAEVERSLAVLDAAVLCISAVEGVQAQTEQYCEALQRQGIPLFVFINKIDRVGADTAAVCHSLEEELGLTLLDAADPDSWLEILAESDEELADAWLLGEEVSKGRVAGALREQTAARLIVPWLAGSALQGKGIEELLDLVVLASPLAGGDPEGPLAAYVYKVEHDPKLGRIAHIRLYSGTLRNRMSINNKRTGSSYKAVQIRKPSGRRTQDTGFLEAGDIAAAAGFADVIAGDRLGEQSLVPQSPAIAVALLRVRADLQGSQDYTPLVAACQMLAAEDPKLSIIWEPSIRELLLHVTGKIQIEILTEELSRRFGLDVQLTEPEVIYKETPSGIAEGFDAYTMPKPCWAVTRFRVEPLPLGSGVRYESIVPDTKIHYRYQGQVAQTVPLVLRQGSHGWEVTDIAVTLIDGEDHPIHTHPLDFATVTPIALRRALLNSKTILLEPLWRFRLLVPENAVGKMISEIINMRGTLDAIPPEEEDSEISGRRRLLTGTVPAATSLDFPVFVAQRTSGRGILTLRFAGYQPAPVGEQHNTPYRGIDPLDRDRYILYIRGAIK